MTKKCVPIVDSFWHLLSWSPSVHRLQPLVGSCLFCYAHHHALVFTINIGECQHSYQSLIINPSSPAILNGSKIHCCYMSTVFLSQWRPTATDLQGQFLASLLPSPPLPRTEVPIQSHLWPADNGDNNWTTRRDLIQQHRDERYTISYYPFYNAFVNFVLRSRYLIQNVLSIQKRINGFSLILERNGNVC